MPSNNRISIKTQLFGLLALLMLLVAMSIGVALRFLETQNDRSDYVSDVMAQRSIVAQQWIVSLLESARHTRNVLILDDPIQIKQELVRLAAEIDERANHLERLKKLSDNEDTIRLLANIERSRDAYLPLEETYVKLIEAGDFKQARELLLNKTRPAQLVYIEELYRYIEPALRQLKAEGPESTAAMAEVRSQILMLGGLALLFAAVAGWWVTRNMLGQLGGEPQLAVELAQRIAQGERGVEVAVAAGDQSSLMHALNAMARALTVTHLSKERSDWVKSGLADLSLITRRELPPQELAQELLGYVLQRLQASVGAVYFYHPAKRQLQRVAVHGLLEQAAAVSAFELGQGLVGQAALQPQLTVISPLPAGYLHASSGTGGATPEAVLLLPLQDASGLIGLLEIGAFQAFGEAGIEFIELAAEGLGVGLGSALARQRTHELLATTQAQSEELQSQQEELEQNNGELREHAQALDSQRRELDLRNAELLESSAEIEWRAQELERVSRYKSEFLANMSHELRTPLNSMLMLSALLQDNREQTLTPKQSKFAGAIHAAGQDLLSLINDILDLSKIEAGQVEYLYEPCSVAELCEPLRQMFSVQAQQKGLTLAISPAADLPALLSLDLRRTQQVLKNLLSNAIKFTARGRVELKLDLLDAAASPLKVPTLAMAVSDNGIGIAADKQALVFEAFKQADGGISRSYGGTGLGLSISRQLAFGLQGQLTLLSQPGEGSTFTLLLPVQPETAALPLITEPAAGASTQQDKAAAPSEAQGRQILVVEDDLNFQGVLLERCQQRGLTTLSAADGETALALARQHLPAAILLDVMMPKLNGWDVMRHLQSDPLTAQIPVHFITALDERARAIELGAASFATKPITLAQLDTLLEQVEQSSVAAPARVLIVEDNAAEAYALSELLSGPGVQVQVAASGQEALACLQQAKFDALVLDLGLGDIKGEDLLRQIRIDYSADQLPVLVHSGHNPDRGLERSLRHLAQVLIVKGDYSPARVRQEVQSLLGARNSLAAPMPVQAESPPASNCALPSLKGRTVLLADDDMRNIFAIGSLLGYHGVNLIEAENGREALELLAANPQIELILMDIMMPEMDGYSAIRAIRADSSHPEQARLPIIAMTAKTMPGDRDLCLAAGASDYIAKPLDNEKLLSMMQVWLGAPQGGTTGGTASARPDG